MNLEVIGQIILATFLGSLIGFEREIKKKGAGLQTFSLISLASCLFTLISFELINLFIEKGQGFDPTRIIQAMAIGIGFVGAGVIFRQGEEVVGLTTAATLLATSAVGVAVGAKLYLLAVFSTFLTLFVLAGFGWLEKKFF